MTSPTQPTAAPSVDRSESRPEQDQGSPAPATSSSLARLGRTAAIYSALGIGTLLAGGKLADYRIRSGNRETFGTFEEPRFVVRAPAPSNPIRSLDQLQPGHLELPAGISTGAEAPEELVADIRAALRKARTIVGHHGRGSAADTQEGSAVADLSPEKWSGLRNFALGAPEVAIVREHLRSLGRAAEYGVTRIELRAFICELAEVSAIRELGPGAIPPSLPPGVSSIDYARAIFQRVTGAAVPDSVRIVIAEIDEVGIAGTAEAITRQVVAEPSSYAEEVSVICHELGHLIARPGEEFARAGGVAGVLMFGARIDRSIRVLEEASAYAFERVCIGAIPDPAVREAAMRGFESQLLQHAQRYCAGEQDIHFEAGVLADAAVRVLGSPVEAYRYLSSTREVSPEIRRTMEESRAICARFPSTRCRAAARELQALRVEIETLCSELAPPPGH